MVHSKNFATKRSAVGDFLEGATVGGHHRRRPHEANFARILPSTMKKLLSEGLFEPDGNGSYKITAKGLATLKDFENE